MDVSAISRTVASLQPWCARQRDAQQTRGVGVDRHRHAGAPQFINRVRVERGVDLQREVRARADAQGDLSSGEQRDSVLDRAHVVIDAVGTEQLDGIAHALRATAFACVHGPSQPGGAGAAKGFGEARAGPACGGLVAVDRQRDHADGHVRFRGPSARARQGRTCLRGARAPRPWGAPSGADRSLRMVSRRSAGPRRPSISDAASLAVFSAASNAPRRL